MKPFTADWWYEQFEICASEVRAHAFTVGLYEGWDSDSERADNIKPHLFRLRELLHFTVKRYAIAYHREQQNQSK